MTAISYQSLLAEHGPAADSIGEQICAIHGGMGFFDFKTHKAGIDISGCSEANQAKIKALVSKKVETKEGK